MDVSLCANMNSFVRALLTVTACISHVVAQVVVTKRIPTGSCVFNNASSVFSTEIDNRAGNFSFQLSIPLLILV